jgi:sporulation protein YtfJ
MSESTANEILDTLMKNLKELVTTKSVVGEPIQAGDATIIPIMKVALGFGAGGGTTSEKTQTRGGGGGGGVSITPVGFLVLEGGNARMITPGQANKWDGIVDAIPDLVDKFTQFRAKSKAGKQTPPASDNDAKTSSTSGE